MIDRDKVINPKNKLFYLYLGLGLVGYYLVLFVIFYFGLFSLSFYSPFFYFYLFLLLLPILYLVVLVILDKFYPNKEYKSEEVLVTRNKKVVVGGKQSYITKVLLSIFGGIVGLVVILALAGTTIFHAKHLSEQLTITDGTKEEFEETFSYDTNDVKLPIIDKDLAFRLAEQTLGNYGAQYTVNYDNFTIISVMENGEEKLYRVTPLEYSGFFVAMNKMSQGSVGYIKVNVETQEASLVEVPEGIKYLESGMFNYDLKRKVRMAYPTKLFNKFSFEIDDNGHPYWVIPTYKNECVLFQGSNSTGTIVMDACTGEMNFYNIGEEPSFIDRVCDANLVDKQATYALKYKNGFFNATIGAKKDVFRTSEGYNYFIKHGHTYYVSCITSVNSNDQTSIGFIAIDLKTKEAYRYLIPGITEKRARDILMLDESVKAQRLDATWPILINYRGVPTYFVALKNDVQFQLACLINVSDGSISAMGPSLHAAAKKYESLLSEAGKGEIEKLELEGVVTDILFREEANEIDFKLEGIDGEYFVVNISLSIDARFLKPGDKIKITYQKSASYNYVLSLEKIK